MIAVLMVWIGMGACTWVVRGGVLWKYVLLGPLLPVVCLVVLLFNLDEKHPEWRPHR